MIEKILVAYDNGKNARKALETAIDIAKGHKAKIHIVVSVKMPDFISSVAPPAILKDLEGKSQEYFVDILKEPEEKVLKEGLPVITAILYDKPGEAIVAYAEKEGIDLIVMGYANRNKLESLLLGLGSVSNYVLQHAKIPVMVTKG